MKMMILNLNPHGLLVFRPSPVSITVINSGLATSL